MTDHCVLHIGNQGCTLIMEPQSINSVLLQG